MQTAKDTIKDRLPISDLLGSYITLSPSGTQFKARCPFHTERTASFSVSPERGLYYCFGCGAKGDIFTFVQQFEGVDFKGALKILADRAGVKLNDYDDGKKERTDVLYEVLEKATLRYQNELMSNPDAQAYLAKRGLTPETIKAFRLGYAPDEWHFISTNTLSKEERSNNERAGLTKSTDKGQYDRFRKRIMFPLADASGRVVGFSGRLYPEDKEKDTASPKYLNSPETEVFQKSRILYCFDKAKLAIRQAGFAILVEGQMDAVISHQYGFRNTIATSGTAVSETMADDVTSNLSVVARLTPHLFLAFDGDKAGQKALDRAALVALTLGMNPKVVPLPEGVDPADFIAQEGKEKWHDLLKESKHFILHELALLHRTSLSAHVLVTKIKERLFPFLSRIPSPVEQKLYIEAIAKDVGVTAEEVMKELVLYVSHTPTQPAAAKDISRVPQGEGMTTAERFLAFVQCFPSEKTAALEQKLRALTFEDEVFVFPEIDEVRKHSTLLLIEREYGTLAPDARDLLVAELAANMQEAFFAGVRAKYTRLLTIAEQSHDEAQATILMTSLQKLNRLRHEP